MFPICRVRKGRKFLMFGGSDNRRFKKVYISVENKVFVSLYPKLVFAHAGLLIVNLYYIDNDTVSC